MSGLTVDQLAFTVSNSSGKLVDHTPRPKMAAGRLSDPQTIEIYLRDDLGNTRVTCEVDGLSANRLLATFSENVQLETGKLVPVVICLGNDCHRDAGTDGTGLDAKADAGVDADAARVDVPVDLSADASADRVDADPVDVAPDVSADGPKALGVSCQIADECDSGVCVDGVCCESTCGICQACNVPGSLGRCAPVAVKTPSTLCVDQTAALPCGYNGTCDGHGGCFRPAAGQMCAPASCAGSTFNPVRACDGQGACVAAVPVSCAPFNCDPTGGSHCRTTCSGAGDCVSTAQCNNNSCGVKPKKNNGAGCTADGDCNSNICSDGVCCDGRCGGQCQSCTLAGTVGQCKPVPNLKGDPHGICKDNGAATCGTNGLCDGAGGCAKYPVGSVCEAAQCVAHAIVGARHCDAAGTCGAPALSDCAPYRCDPVTTTCFTSCTIDAQCAIASGNSCKKDMCR
ncbi:MAG TPA: hypothetical protein VH374_25280 [Polyangia bacterium]|nr:hypothetical protein [Polyangia bacterium]